MHCVPRFAVVGACWRGGDKFRNGVDFGLAQNGGGRAVNAASFGSGNKFGLAVYAAAIRRCKHIEPSGVALVEWQGYLHCNLPTQIVDKQAVAAAFVCKAGFYAHFFCHINKLL